MSLKNIIKATKDKELKTLVRGCRIIANCDNVKIDISDDGRVVIYHQDREAINKAKDMILEIIKIYAHAY